jgi:hypothetical protein
MTDNWQQIGDVANKVIHAIPTTYKGVNFRSRLEAKWACMFDQLGWDWSYEAIDLKGWIPDFVITGKPKQILVEVKPIFGIDECPDICAEISQAVGHKDESGKFETLICGAALPDTECQDGPGIGWLWDGDWGVGYVFHLATEHKQYGLCSDCMSWADRISGLYEGDHYLGGTADLKTMWINATNEIQWKARR